MLTEPVSPNARWALDPVVVHLNHGSFGGCLRSVLDVAAAARARVEAAPMRFFVLEWQTELDRARAALAAFVGADAERMAFVPSSTTGVAIALHSATIAAGDEILTTSHVYAACLFQLQRLATERGARIVIVDIALPFEPDELVASVAAAITPRTRLALLDHITSPTALRLPIERLIPLFSARDIPVLVDGAHAPGQIELDVERLGATWYVGNCHKWLCAPKASGFLAWSAAAAATLRPLVTSHGASAAYGPANRQHAELDWSGTYDPSAQLAVPSAITAMAHEGGGWPAILARNHALALELRDRLADGTSARLAPDHAIGTMAAIPIALPAGTDARSLERALLVSGWEVPIVDHPSGPLVRVSAHLYNHAGEADLLAGKLRSLGVRIRGDRD
ncbi:MAG: isopenicillin N-epimerase [Myxococcales bacterium]|nr:isopenicillin N-epimerase [Myxococcales bacterium]